MRCRCGGEMHETRVECVDRWGNKGPYVRVTGVPAWVCDRCGEQEFSEDVVVRLQKLVRAGAEGASRIEDLPVKEFVGALVGR